MPVDANLPIGVFDSGMGGLTVLAALRRALPAENFLYLGDTARLPYGTKTPATVSRYALQAADQLVARGVKALVVACNTASAFALNDLQRAYAPLPVFGVVEPGAMAAARGADARGVLVVATESTISSGVYQRALTALQPRVPVYGRACPLWVTLAEQGEIGTAFVEAILRQGLRGYQQAGPGVLLLGCTHFPVFKAQLRALVPSMQVVDSAETTAQVVAEALAQREALAVGAQGGVSFMATDGSERFARVGRHFLGEPIASVEWVEL